MSESEIDSGAGQAAPRGPWYREGLCFSCTQCGACCRVEGFVWVDRDQIEAIAARLAMSAADFARRYVRRVGKSYSLIEKPNKECIFWDGGCRIYDVRPVQCRTFPFWPEHLEDREAWREVGRECPGVNLGRCYDEREIERLARGDGRASAESEESR